MSHHYQDGADYLYQANFCEENIWWLCHESYFDNKSAFVLFIANPRNTRTPVQVRAQRAGSDPSQLVRWDYHVILLSQDIDTQQWLVWDFDTTLGFPCTAREYLPCLQSTSPTEQAGFRVVTRGQYLKHFGSDRSDMTGVSVPPRWAPIQPEKQTLPRFRNLTRPFFGTVLSLYQLQAILSK